MANRLTVSDIMTPNVVTIGLDDTVQTARDIFQKRRFHHLVVLENGRPLGVISDRDLLRHLSPFVGVVNAQRPQDLATLKMRMHQIMTRKLIAVPPNWTAAEAVRLMSRHNVSCLPVIDEQDQLVGIVTLRDIVKWALHHCIGVGDLAAACSAPTS